MTSPRGITFRVATSDDVAAMGRCRLSDPAAGPADPRMAAYFDGHHHPHQALAPRIGYVAIAGDTVVAYIAGHRTRRHGYDGEVQYLFVAQEYRRRGVATALLRQLAEWFIEAEAPRVCVCVDGDSPGAKTFYASRGAAPFKRLWYGWDDIARL